MAFESQDPSTVLGNHASAPPASALGSKVPCLDERDDADWTGDLAWKDSALDQDFARFDSESSPGEPNQVDTMPSRSAYS